MAAATALLTATLGWHAPRDLTAQHTEAPRTTSARALASLDEALRRGLAERLPDPEGVRVTTGTLHTWRTGEVVVVRDWSAPETAHVLVVQPDEHLEAGSGHSGFESSVPPEFVAPLAEVGDVLTLVVGGGERTLESRVLGRARARAADGCGMAIQRSGWVYLMDTPFAELPDHTGPYNAIALAPGVGIRLRDQTGAPDDVRARFQSTYIEEVERVFRASSSGLPLEERELLRSWMFGEDGRGHLDRSRTWALVGPDGPANLVLVNFNDDLGDKGFDTSHAYLLDGEGRVRHRWDRLPPVIAVGDINADGIDELLTELGPIRWDGSRWDIPPGEPFYRGC